MGLLIQVDADTPVRLPLACDPSLQAANPPRYEGEGDAAKLVAAPLLRYWLTSDPEGLVIPPDAGFVTVRALTKPERRRAEATAGVKSQPYSERACLVYSRSIDRVEALTGQGETRASLAALAEMSDVDRALYERHAEWMRLRNRELCRIGLVGLSELPHLGPGPEGFPVEALDEVRWGPDLDADDVLHEAARHLMQIGSLGKALRPSSATSSGVAASTLMPSNAPIPIAPEPPSDATVPSSTPASGG